MPPLPRDDLDQILRATAGLHAILGNQRILITGATGFFGRWLLESLLKVERVDPNALPAITALSRDPERFISANPHLASSPNLRWIKASVTTLTPSRFTGQHFDAVIHLATESDKTATPAASREVIVEGTRRTLEVAAATDAKRFLFTSTAAVTAISTPSTVHRLPSTARYPGAADKLEAERLCLATPQVGPLIARCYSFAGPGLPLDGKFAFGNFLRDALARRPIEIAGDGTAIRSYLYASDLAIWLLTMLVRGTPGSTYDVGSELPISVKELAEAIDLEAGGAGVIVRGKPGTSPIDRYLPLTAMTRAKLGLSETVTLIEAIRKTVAWHRAENA